MLDDAIKSEFQVSVSANCKSSGMGNGGKTTVICSIISLICSILGLRTTPLFWGIAGMIFAIFSIYCMANIDEKSTAGVVCMIIGFVLSCVNLLIGFITGI